jgi:hypothetical protein
MGISLLAAARRSKFKAPAARSKPLCGVQNAFGVFKVQGRFAALSVVGYLVLRFS